MKVINNLMPLTYYCVLLCIFTSGTEGSQMQTPVGSCTLEDNEVVPMEHFNDDTIHLPASFNIHKCVGLPCLKCQNKECVPSTFRTLEVLRNNSGVFTIDTIPNAIVDTCGIVDKVQSCTVEDNNVDPKIHFNDGSITQPKSFNIQKCVGSPGLEYQNKECVPSSFRRLDVLQRNEDTDVVTIGAIENAIVDSCGIVDKQPSCAIEENVVIPREHFEDETLLQPLTFNIQKCVGSPSLECALQECVPKTYRRLEVLRNNSGVIIIDSIPDVIVDSCEIVNKTVCVVEDNVVDPRVHFSDPTLILPTSFNIKKCVGSPDLECQNKECAPSSQWRLEVLRNNTATGIVTIDSIPNAIVGECSIVDKVSPELNAE